MDGTFSERRGRWFALALVAASLLATAVPARGWGPTGHIVVARIAEDRVKPETLQAMEDLLSIDRDAELRDQPHAHISDGYVANWADMHRERDRTTGDWHFIDVNYDEDPAHPDLAKYCADDDCVLAQIRRDMQILKSSTHHGGDLSRVDALKYLVHFVGDVHQPLHCISRTNGDGKPDRGGNALWVSYPGHRDTTMFSLHPVWDHMLLEDKMRAALALPRGTRSISEDQAREYADRLNERIAAGDAQAWSAQPAEEWVAESFRAAKEVAYRGIRVPPATVDDSRAHRATHAQKLAAKAGDLDSQYVEAGQKVVDERLMRAGVRLAHILDEVFAGQQSRELVGDRVDP